MGVAGDVHDRRVPAETTIILAATQNGTRSMSAKFHLERHRTKSESTCNASSKLNLPNVHSI